MGKNRHSKDKLYITATEWATEYGGKRTASREGGSRPLPFDHCALSLGPFKTPVLLGSSTGVIFDLENIVPYIQERKCDPVTGDAVTAKDIIKLHMSKNAEGEWQWYAASVTFDLLVS
jgi:peptidyl-prolyl cis-trans isomerase-like protein 2